MSYEKLGLTDGTTVRAIHLKHIEDGIGQNAETAQLAVTQASEAQKTAADAAQEAQNAMKDAARLDDGAVSSEARGAVRR